MHCREFVAIERRKCRRHVHLDSNAFNKLINEKFHDWFRNKVSFRNLNQFQSFYISIIYLIDNVNYYRL